MYLVSQFLKTTEHFENVVKMSITFACAYVDMYDEIIACMTLNIYNICICINVYYMFIYMYIYMYIYVHTIL